ncbi:MAG: LPXTG cell wall anchor domain-containing protein, partial [Oscillospiraceae bacterium]|nr:LPXTG cell wall anchor domain-containing protein [Oscillospiraceae bacterium]
KTSSGQLQYRFYGERVLDNGQLITVYSPGETIYRTVYTGESTFIFIVAGVLVAAVAVLLITGRKEKKKAKKRA